MIDFQQQIDELKKQYEGLHVYLHALEESFISTEKTVTEMAEFIMKNTHIHE